jgi:hypothetical protein
MRTDHGRPTAEGTLVDVRVRGVRRRFRPSSESVLDAAAYPEKTRVL